MNFACHQSFHEELWTSPETVVKSLFIHGLSLMHFSNWWHKMFLKFYAGSGGWGQFTVGIYHWLCHSSTSCCFLCWSITGRLFVLTRILFGVAFTNICKWLAIISWIFSSTRCHLPTNTANTIGNLFLPLIHLISELTFLLHGCPQSLLSFRKFSAWINPMR